MNLMSEIQGLRGENLASALLRYVFLRSQDARAALSHLLYQETGESFSIHSRFACRAEVVTEHDLMGSGRVDLLIEADDALIAIENKLDAPLQPDQPAKYRESLSRWTATLAKGSFIGQNRFLIVLLAPASRRTDLMPSPNRDGQMPDTCFLAWEVVLGALRTLAPTQDSKTQVVIDELASYVESYFHDSVLEQMPQKSAMLARWIPFGSELQQRVVQRLWSRFPNAGPRLSRGEGWIGYYFADKCWYGFVEVTKACIDPPPVGTAAALVVVTSSDVAGLGEPYFRRIRMKPKWSGSDIQFSWVIDISTLPSLDAWREALIPLHAAFADPRLR